MPEILMTLTTLVFLLSIVFTRHIREERDAEREEREAIRQHERIMAGVEDYPALLSDEHAHPDNAVKGWQYDR